MNSNLNKKIIICSRLVRNGKMIIDLENIRNDLDELNKVLTTSFTLQTKDTDIIEFFRKIYNDLARNDYSYNNQRAKETFNQKYISYAYVRDRH